MAPFPLNARILFFKASWPARPPVRRVGVFFKATFKDQPGYALREGETPKRRWHRGKIMDQPAEHEHSTGNADLTRVQAIARVNLSSAKASIQQLQRVERLIYRYVVGNGERTGHEYFMAYDLDTGRVVGRRTDHQPNRVSPGRALLALSDPQRRIVVTHNHPQNLPPSFADIAQFLLQPGRHTSVVLTQDGSRYEMTPTGLRRATLEVTQTAAKKAADALTARGFSKFYRDQVVGWAVCQALSDLGQLRYTQRLVGDSSKAFIAERSYVQVATELIFRSIAHTR